MLISLFLTIFVVLWTANIGSCFQFPFNSRISSVGKLRAIRRRTLLDADPPIAFCDLKVGKILSIDPINTFADCFYTTTIDIGTDSPLAIHSNIIPDLEKWVDKLVVVLCNRNFTYKAMHSNGKIMSWSKDETETILMVPPPGAKIGEPVRIEGVRPLPPDVKSFSDDALDKTILGLTANTDGAALWNHDKPLLVSTGPVKLVTLKIPHQELRLQPVDIMQYLPLEGEAGWEPILSNMAPENKWRRQMKRHRPPTWADMHTEVLKERRYNWPNSGK